jgi:hypothetical protein
LLARSNERTIAAYAPVALVQAGDPEAIDVYLAEEDARRALEDCLRDEPQWRGSLWVEDVEFDHEHTSLN